MSPFESTCGQSRLWAGVHYQAAINASKPMCKQIGDGAYQYLSRLIAGTASKGGSED